MKLFASFILLATLVVGDGFYQPFSPALKYSPWQASSPAYLPFLPNRPNIRGVYYHHLNLPYNWARYYYTPDPTPNMQGVFAGQQRSASTNKNYGDESVEGWQVNPMEPKFSFSRQRFPSWNHKFFLLDNEAQTVHALRPFNLIEHLSMNLNQQIQPPSVSLTRPIFAKQTVRMTATEILKVTSTKLCLSSNYFLNTINPSVCLPYNRTRRFIDLEDDFLEPTVNQEDLVMPTMLIGDDRRSSPVYEIESTKNDDVDGRLEFDYFDLMPGMTRKDRAMFNRVPSTSTVVIITSETYYVTKAINLVSPVPGQPGALLCVPPGMVVCA